MGQATDIFNFLNPINHANAGKSYKMPTYEISSDLTGETTTIGGEEYTYETRQTNTHPIGALGMNTTGSTTVANIIQGDLDRNYELNKEAMAQAEEERKRLEAEWREGMDFEKFKFTEQQGENALTRNREDTYYQRMMNDLQAAGINPLMAGRLGGAGVTNGIVAGNAVSPTSPVQANTHPYTSQAGALATENNSIRDAEFNYAKLNQDAQINDKNIDLAIKEMVNSNMENDKKYAAEKSLQWIKDLNQLVRDRANASDTAEQNRLTRELNWKIATYSAIKKLVTSTGIKPLDQALEEILSVFTKDNWEEYEPQNLMEMLSKSIDEMFEDISQKHKNDEKLKKEDEKARTRTDDNGIKRHKL